MRGAEMTITVKDLIHLSQAERDQLYKTSPAGDIPKGESTGTALFVFGIVVGKWLATPIRLLAWQGKVFEHDGAVLVNRITPFRIKALTAQVYKAKSILGEGEAIIVDYSKTSIFTQAKDELREVAPGIYLGNALWGKKRLTMFALEFCTHG
jgi:hypothetical protein